MKRYYNARIQLIKEVIADNYITIPMDKSISTFINLSIYEPSQWFQNYSWR